MDEKGLLQNGVIIRHLMLPGLLFDSKKIIDYIHKTYGNNIYISLMNQYTPTFNSSDFPEINKPLNLKHYDALIEHCLDNNINNVFIQDEGTSSESFIPDFNLNNF